MDLIIHVEVYHEQERIKEHVCVPRCRVER